jgi:hypothetical protein
MFPVVVSPYDVHARSIASSVAMLLGEPAVTLLPAPLEGTDARTVAGAVFETPGFERFMERWRWSGPLWHEGALRAGHMERSPLAYVQRAAAEIAADAGGSVIERRLSQLVGETRFEETYRYLQSVCRDLDRGGGDPAVSVPIAVGLAAFASDTGASMAVMPTPSVVSRFERRTERPVGRLVTSVVHGASGRLLLELRDALAEELHALRAALRDLLDGVDAGPRTRDAGGALADAVAAVPEGILGPRDEDEVRVRGGVRRAAVSISVVRADAASSLVAAQRAATLVTKPSRGGRGARTAVNEAARGTAALARTGAVRLIVKELPLDA